MVIITTAERHGEMSSPPAAYRRSLGCDYDPVHRIFSLRFFIVSFSCYKHMLGQ
jgi:hypothetical protein